MGLNSHFTSVATQTNKMNRQTRQATPKSHLLRKTDQRFEWTSHWNCCADTYTASKHGENKLRLPLKVTTPQGKISVLPASAFFTHTAMPTYCTIHRKTLRDNFYREVQICATFTGDAGEPTLDCITPEESLGSMDYIQWFWAGLVWSQWQNSS